MKRVFLIRHAEAGFSGGGRGDHGRELTDEGRNQARQLGQLLAEAGIETVLASSASRAAQTAAGMGLSAPVTLLDELYNAGTPDLLAVLAAQAVPRTPATDPGVPCDRQAQPAGCLLRLALPPTPIRTPWQRFAITTPPRPRPRSIWTASGATRQDPEWFGSATAERTANPAQWCGSGPVSSSGTPSAGNAPARGSPPSAAPDRPPAHR